MEKMNPPNALLPHISYTQHGSDHQLSDLLHFFIKKFRKELLDSEISIISINSRAGMFSTIWIYIQINTIITHYTLEL